jgi:hypothetical protein
MVLLQEHLDPESLKHYGLYLRIGTYCCAAFLFISLLIVRKYEKNQWEELDEKQQKLRKFNEEARAASENNLPQEESK